MAASRNVFNRCGSGMVFTACLGACICTQPQSLGLREHQPKPTVLRPIRLPALLRLRRRRYASCRAPKIGRVKCVEPSLRQLRDARTASLQLQTIALSSTASVLQALQATSTSQRVLDDKKSLALNCTCAVSLPSPRLDNYSLSAASKQCIFLTA